MKASCQNCQNLEMEKKDMMEGRLSGKYRYGCKRRKNGYVCGFLSCDESLELLCCSYWSGKGKKGLNVRNTPKEYGEKLQQMYDRWALWEKGGCPDAEVPDGMYLNRLRSGIEGLCRKIEAVFSEEEYPESYYAMLPPLMDEGYMANGEVIRENAKKALSVYENHRDYIWLSSHAHEFDNRIEISGEICRLLYHRDMLKEAIQKDELFLMKRESRQEHLISALAVCREKAEALSKKQRKRRVKKEQIAGQIGINGLKAS